ncbi:MAG: glycosyl transferase family 2 [Sphingomonas bacterium]|nr:glycosyltransferase family 2 protein [Sphingomonas bacterium]MDB5689572.1 glycosyl transferase family 2 [Sphingomonas bacterium]
MSGHSGTVLVVIPCLDEEAHLPALLNQLLATQAAGTFVVADGGSTDASRSIVLDRARQDPRLRLLDNPARLQSAGINRAVRLHGAAHDWLVRIDAHCDYPDRYVEGLIAAAKASGAASVVVPMVSRGRRGFQIAAAAAQNSKLGTGGSLHRHVGVGRFVDHGHHALMSIAAFVQAGGYDESMATNEDAELDHRIGQAGGRIWLEPSLALTYYPRATPLALWRQYLRYGRGRAQTVRRHAMRLKVRQLIPLGIPAAAAAALLAPLWWPLALPLVVWAVVCLVAGLAIGARARSSAAMLSGVAAMIMHLGWGCGFLAERLGGRPPRSTRRPASTG